MLGAWGTSYVGDLWTTTTGADTMSPSSVLAGAGRASVETTLDSVQHFRIRARSESIIDDQPALRRRQACVHRSTSSNTVRHGVRPERASFTTSATENREAKSPRRLRAIPSPPSLSLVNALSEDESADRSAPANPATTCGCTPTPAAITTGILPRHSRPPIPHSQERLPEANTNLHPSGEQLHSLTAWAWACPWSKVSCWPMAVR